MEFEINILSNEKLKTHVKKQFWKISVVPQIILNLYNEGRYFKWKKNEQISTGRQFASDRNPTLIAFEI